MGVACLYTLMFLPLTPMACLFSLALGFGLLGLAPLLSLPCNWISGKTVCHLAARKITYFNAHQVEHLGHMIILVMVIAIELPSTLTRINLSLTLRWPKMLWPGCAALAARKCFCAPVMSARDGPPTYWDRFMKAPIR